MGGTDDPSNLIELTIEEHAEAHRLLFIKYNKHQDYVAWKGLTAEINNEALLLEKSRMGGKSNLGKPKTKEHRNKISENHSGGVEEHTIETKQKIATAMLGNSNSSNHSSNEYKTKQSQAMKAAWQRRKYLGIAQSD